jgi:hypothetical protein
MALTCTWGGYADTDLNFREFFNSDHTVCVRFMLQYPHAYTGPMISVNGTGTYLIGQGDFFFDLPEKKVKLVMKIGTGKVIHQVDLLAGTWHHLAVRRSGTTFQMFLDGISVGSSLTLPVSDLPSGTMRFGKNTFNAALDGGGGAQFYGILDDIAIFKKALPKIDELARAHHILGTEEDLHAAYVFGYVPPEGLTDNLERPVTLTPGANIIEVSPDRNNAADSANLPLGLTTVALLPFAVAEKLEVVQGYDDPNSSHHSDASFCLDLVLAGKPCSESNGHPFRTASPGTVDFVKEDAESGGALSNFITIKQSEHEFCDYLHLVKDSAEVNVGDEVSFEKYLAKMGDTGVRPGGYHLHMAVSTLGEGHKYSGGSFVTIPAPLTNYDESDDQGTTWKHVFLGVPRKGQWVRKAPPRGPTAQGDDMQPGEVLNPEQSISSANGRYTFVYQGDGNLVLYRIRDWMPLWASNTAGSLPRVCIMQTDGNLVIYESNAYPIWDSGTWQYPSSRLIVQDDGNVVIYNPSNQPVWATNTVTVQVLPKGTLRVSVTPFPTPLRKGVNITVHAEDTETGQTVPGTVRLENFNERGSLVVQQFPTDVATYVFLRTKQVREPDGGFDFQEPWGDVIADGYPLAQIDFGF